MKPSKCKCETNCELAAGKMKVKACRVGSWLLLKCINQNLLRCLASLFQISYFGVVSALVEVFPIMQSQRGKYKFVFFFFFPVRVVKVRISICSLGGWPSNGEMRASENVYFSLMKPLGNHNFVYSMLWREYENIYGVSHQNL